MNAADLLTASAAAEAWPGASGATAVHWVDRDRSLTYAEAVDAMARAAAVLSGFGVAPGGRVGLFAHPGLDYVVALLGAWRLGATAVLVDLADKDRFGDLMTAAPPDAVVYTNDHFDYVRPTVAALGSAPTGPCSQAWTVLSPARSAGWMPWPRPSPSPSPPHPSTPTRSPSPFRPRPPVRLGQPVHPVTPSDPPDSVNPSDSATPEPTQRTHTELIEAASAVAASLDLGPSDSTLCPTPLAHPFHLEASILPALLRGATAGLLKVWHPDDAWEQMERNGTTVLCGTPRHCTDLLSVSAARGRKPSALRAAITVEDRSPASDPAVGELADRFRTELGIDAAVHRPAS